MCFLQVHANFLHLLLVSQQLFRARATPVYNIVAFEASHDIQRDDPLKKAFEYARMARRYASKIQVRQ